MRGRLRRDEREAVFDCALLSVAVPACEPLVPTARFAQPISAFVLYPMLALSGLFFPIGRLPRWLETIAYALPTTHAVALLNDDSNDVGKVHLGVVHIFDPCPSVKERDGERLLCDQERGHDGPCGNWKRGRM